MTGICGLDCPTEIFLASDFRIGSWQMSWSAKPDSGRFAADGPTSNFFDRSENLGLS